MTLCTINIIADPIALHIETIYSVPVMNDDTILTFFKKAVEQQDEAAWRIIWQQYQPVIAKKLRRELMNWGTTPEGIQDLAQAVFMKFWEDTLKWDVVDRLYTQDGKEGILSRLHSTTVFLVQHYRQKQVRAWIPVIRLNFPLCSDSERDTLVDLADSGLSLKYRELFLLHLSGCENRVIAEQLKLVLRDVSIKINRSWERFVYVLLKHRHREQTFEPLFQFLITYRQGEF